MKKIRLILLVTIMLCSLAACGDSTTDTTSTPTAAIIEPAVEPDTTSNSSAEGHNEFVYFESQDLGLRLGYPDTWYELNTFSNPDSLAQMEDLTGMSAELLSQALSQVQLFLYNYPQASETFVPNLNLVVSDAGGASFADLTSASSLAELKGFFTSEYTQTFENFEWITEPAAETFGNNRYITVHFGYTMSEEDIRVMQAMAVERDAIYSFTYTYPTGTATDGTFETLDELFASAEFFA